MNEGMPTRATALCWFLLSNVVEMLFAIPLLSIILFFLLLLSSIWWYATSPANLPPGPLGVPFLGSTFHVSSVQMLTRKMQEWAKKYGPIYSINSGGKLVVVLASNEAFHEAFVKQPEVFVVTTKKIGVGGIGTLEGQEWNAHRKLALTAQREFSVGKGVLEQRMGEQCEQLANAIMAYNGSPFSPTLLIMNAVTNIICAQLFGRTFQYDDKNLSSVLKHLWMHVDSLMDVAYLSIIDRSIANVSMPKKKAAVMKLVTEIDRFTSEQIANIKQKFDPDEDEPMNYVEHYLKTQKTCDGNSSLNDHHLLRNCCGLFIAGTLSTMTALKGAIVGLAELPEWQERVYNEIRHDFTCQSSLKYADRMKYPLTEAVMMEALRVTLGPASMPRQTVADCRLGGYDIPAGSVIVPLFSAIFYNPSVYPNPLTFDPSRFTHWTENEKKPLAVVNFIPFFIGKRRCLGESLARTELFVFLTSLVSKFKFSVAPSATDVPQSQLTLTAVQRVD